ncbi:amidase [Sphingomonas sp. CFBP 13720]|uniref:amidase n=1 Tax=Sphingomonas sp. CFBP 13720 TaxID=2775302 RepID=UPI00177D075B|nr:amidase [Sphingomonas sp. CFBP 13720]MBD8677609.1 amidase [Sphingomonas sp. CFBP 13720]
MRQTGWMAAMAVTVAAPVAVPAAAQSGPVVEERGAAQSLSDMAAGHTTAEALTAAYLARIAAIDRRGPTLRSVIAINPDALAQARALDAERRAGRIRGPLHGLPVLVKDNIETRENATTAGSLALRDNRTGRDAPVVARLRAAGAVILGKTNLSEWANIRSSSSMSGWSAVGGLVRNPYALDRSACGSSSGTGAAIAASLAAIGVGTETDGSVVCPAAMNGLVGLKPTIGMVSRARIVPISHSQDTAGPMARDVRDAALLFAAMVGSDPADPTTAGADSRRRDYAAGLSANALKGARIAVLRPDMPDALAVVYARALDRLKAAGAILIDVKQPDLPGLGEAEFTVLKAELKADLNSYLATTPRTVKTRTLADVIAFNTRNATTEMPFFGQETFVAAQAMPELDDPAYRAARANSKAQAAGAIDAMLATAGATLLVAPTYGTPWLSDPVQGDHFSGPSASELPAVSGYPHLTVPMGLARGLPAGLSFIGPEFSEARLLGAGYAFEQAARARVAPTYRATVDAGPALNGTR